MFFPIKRGGRDADGEEFGELISTPLSWRDSSAITLPMHDDLI